MDELCVKSHVLMTADAEGTPGWEAFLVAFSRSYQQQHLSACIQVATASQRSLGLTPGAGILGSQVSHHE